MKRSKVGALLATAFTALCLSVNNSAEAQSHKNRATALKQSEKSSKAQAKHSARPTMTQQARRDRNKTKLSDVWHNPSTKGDENRATPARPGVSPAVPSPKASQKTRTTPSRTDEQRYGIGNTWQKPSPAKSRNKGGGKRK